MEDFRERIYNDSMRRGPGKHSEYPVGYTHQDPDELLHYQEKGSNLRILINESRMPRLDKLSDNED